jgi:ADP-ribose pyrophosphatase YjhB (NUDIX family)
VAGIDKAGLGPAKIRIAKQAATADPRGHIVSVAYATHLPSDALPRAGSDASSAEWVDLRQITLGFDPPRIDAKAKLGGGA